jgi:selenophosphate synthase
MPGERHRLRKDLVNFKFTLQGDSWHIKDQQQSNNSNNNNNSKIIMTKQQTPATIIRHTMKQNRPIQKVKKSMETLRKNKVAYILGKDLKINIFTDVQGTKGRCTEHQESDMGIKWKYQ